MFIVIYWRSSQTAAFDHFTLLIGRGHHKSDAKRRCKACRVIVLAHQTDCF